MSYFEPSKFTTSGANFIEEQRARLKQLIADVDRIAVVGVAVRERDSHIWGALAKTKASIYFCSGKSAKKAFEAWAAKNRASNSNDIASAKYWGDDFVSVAKHISLGGKDEQA
jgi:hypothetical protein